MKRVLLVIISISSLLVFSGCGSDNPASTGIVPDTTGTDSTIDESTPSTKPTEEPDNSISESNSYDDELKDLWDKLETSKEKDNKKKIMKAIAWDDYLTYKRGGDSEFPEIWKELGLTILDDDNVDWSLDYDLNNYILYNRCAYETLWTGADFLYTLYISGKMEEKDPELYADFKDLVDKVLNN